MSVTKSKFESEAGGAALDIDDPGKMSISLKFCSHRILIYTSRVFYLDFWSKVMPDFITPEILISKLGEMEEAFEKPVGGRRAKNKSDDEEKGLSRGNIKKVRVCCSYFVYPRCNLKVFFSLAG